MLVKLALRNARRSARDYAIYLITLTIAFALIYAFNLIAFSEDVAQLSSVMESFSIVILIASIIVVVTVGWLIDYMVRFMLQRRSREFGTYMMLGIENRKLANLFCLENACMGLVAFLLGLLLGTLLYQLLTLIIMRIFQSPYQISLGFSTGALLLTAAYGLLILTISFLRNRRRLRRMKICDLLGADKKNESAMLKKPRGNIVIGLFSLACGVAGLVLLNMAFAEQAAHGSTLLIAALVGIVICLYGCYGTAAALISRHVLRREAAKYRGDRLFLMRTLTAKINTMSFTLGTLALLLTLTLSASMIGLAFKGYFEEQALNRAPCDVLIAGRDQSADLAPYQDYLHAHSSVESELVYNVYKDGSATIYDRLEDTPLGGTYTHCDLFMRYSDYVALRALMGYAPATMGADSYIFHCTQGGVDWFEEFAQDDLTVDGRALTCAGVYAEPFSLEGMNGAFYLIVVADALCDTMEVESRLLAVDTAEETTKALYDGLCAVYDAQPGADKGFYGPIIVRSDALTEGRSNFTIFVFSLFYLALVFTCVAATILAVQQLSDSSRYKFRYAVLAKLGMAQADVDRLIRKQLLLYFGLPLLLPLPISILATVFANRALAAYVGSSIVTAAIAGSLIGFGLVYLLYFAATVIGFQKTIRR